jgi:PAS domain S-box-containing protein
VATSEGAKRLDSDAFLRALAGSSDVAIIGTALDGTIVFWNEAAHGFYGYCQGEILGRNVATLVPEERLGELAELLDSVRAGETVRNLRTQRVRRSGDVVDVDLTISPVLDADGVVLGGSVITRDLTAHLRQVEDLRDAHRRADEALSTLAVLQASAPVGIGFLDQEFRYVHVNEMFASLTGSTPDQLLGRRVADVVPTIWPRVEPIYRRVLLDDEAVLNVEITGESSDIPGRRRFWLASYYPVDLLDETIGIGIVLVDITERRRSEEIRSVAMRQMSEGLFTVDVDGGLTSMNVAAATMLGWTEEELLGKRMLDVVLAGDDGGPDVAAGDRELPRVRKEGENVRLDNHMFRCKDGSLLPVAMSASPLIIGDAVEGAVVVFRDITEEQTERLRIKRELDGLSWVGRIRDAIDEDRFVLYSQPIVPLRGGRPSEELLLRMVDRNGAIIPPGEFLDTAERYGLITEIDQWVIRQAVRRAARGIHVGANVSAESIVTLDLVSLISRELRDSGADPSNLVFEITETALMRDIGKAEVFARGVVDLGCSLALDDFGTGFGTFTHVKKLPITYLKIDIEFVRDLVSNAANQHVVKAIVNLAQGFGCLTIAEGVEDRETLDLLDAFGVDFAQGYLLGRPTPL